MSPITRLAPPPALFEEIPDFRAPTTPWDKTRLLLWLGALHIPSAMVLGPAFTVFILFPSYVFTCVACTLKWRREQKQGGV